MKVKNICIIVRPFSRPSLKPLAVLATTGSSFRLGTACDETTQSDHEMKLCATAPNLSTKSLSLIIKKV